MSAQTVGSPYADLCAWLEQARLASLPKPPRRRREPSAWHRQTMTEYRVAREAYEIEREARTRGHGTENADDAEFHAPYTLKRHLEGLRGVAQAREQWEASQDAC